MSIVAREIPKEVGAALQEEMRIEMREAQRRTPVLTGALRDSFKLSGPKIDSRGNASVEITCGGRSAPYAGYVHENLEAHHRVGQAKFLESTLRESSPHMALRVSRRIAFDRLWKR
jgi:hypothetical protein